MRGCHESSPCNGHQMIYIDGLVQDCSNSSASAVELLHSCTKPSICSIVIPMTFSKTITMKNQCVLNHRQIYCLFKSLFRLTTKSTKLQMTDLCERKSTGHRWFPLIIRNMPIPYHHHTVPFCPVLTPLFLSFAVNIRRDGSPQFRPERSPTPPTTYSS